MKNYLCPEKGVINQPPEAVYVKHRGSWKFSRGSIPQILWL